MNKDEIQKKVTEYSSVEEWNHNYLFPFGITTKNDDKVSPGNNVNKWKRLNKIFKNINILNKSIIDVGCSDGYYSNKCALLGAKYVLGIDPDDLRINRAKFASEILKIKNVGFKNLDIFNNHLNDKNFDIVLALGILHRVPDLYGFLKRLTELGDILILEFKTFETSDSLSKWGGGETKLNKFNRLFFIPSIQLVTDLLDHLNFDIKEVDRDNSKLKYKRTIITAQKKKILQNIVFENYKDKHKNERVFLIGNGPSLAETDLSLLKNEITIAMNRISLTYNKFKDWRPSYYIYCSTNIIDKKWGNEWLSSVKSAIAEKSTTCFVASKFKERIDPQNIFTNIKWFNSLSETKPDSKGNINNESFSTNIVERIDKSGTTMNMALQLAYHMGFKEIVFLGTDLGWTKDIGTNKDPNHFDKNYRANISNPYKANQQMRNVHRLALSIFNKNKPHVKIYNASIRTVLDIYPIIEFSDYIKENKIVKRDKAREKAILFWKNQTYEPVKSGYIEKVKNKIKTIIKLILKKSINKV
jgi:SAM-dependent methyltransferase